MKYFIFDQNVDGNYIHLINVANDKIEENAILEMGIRNGHKYKSVPSAVFFKDCGSSIENRILHLLKTIGIDEEKYSKLHRHIYVEIEGDWRHSHLFCDYLMGKIFNCNLLQEREIVDNGSDYYKSVHEYYK